MCKFYACNETSYLTHPSQNSQPPPPLNPYLRGTPPFSVALPFFPLTPLKEFGGVGAGYPIRNRIATETERSEESEAPPGHPWGDGVWSSPRKNLGHGESRTQMLTRRLGEFLVRRRTMTPERNKHCCSTLRTHPELSSTIVCASWAERETNRKKNFEQDTSLACEPFFGVPSESDE